MFFLPYPTLENNDTTGMQRYYKRIYKDIRKAMSTVVHTYSDHLDEAQLIKDGFKQFHPINSKKYISPILDIETKYHAELLYKLALLDNMQFKEYPFDGTKLSDLIFLKDKYSKNLGNSETLCTRLNLFRAGIDWDNKTDVPRLRHYGTVKGGLVYSTDRSFQFKETNQNYLKVLQSGSEISGELICHVRNTELTGRFMTNFVTMDKIAIFDGQIHHALYNGAGSYYKSADPSSYLGKMSFVDFSHSVHMEFLGCITLSGDGHDSIHNSNSVDGINNWLKRIELKECVSIPFAWRSKENYQIIINWLSKNTNNFRIDHAPSYQQFMLMHSTEVLKDSESLIRLNIASPKKRLQA